MIKWPAIINVAFVSERFQKEKKKQRKQQQETCDAANISK